METSKYKTECRSSSIGHLTNASMELRSKRLVGLLVFFTIAQLTVAQNWTRLGVPYGRHLNGVLPVATDNVLFVGGSPANDSIASVFKSNSLGASSTIQLDAANNPWIHAISMVNGNEHIAVGDVGSVWKSVDNGVNWNEVATSTTSNLYDVVFVSGTAGFAVGGIAGSDSILVVLETTNAGDSWNTIVAHQNDPLRSIAFANSDLGIAVGDEGTILRTTDGGANWNYIPAPISRNYNAVAFKNANEIFAVGGVDGADSVRTIISSVDGGQNWSVVMDVSGSWLTDIDFISEDSAYAVGSNGIVLNTDNGGANWSEVTIPSGSDNDFYTAVEFLGSQIGFFVGRNGLLDVLHPFDPPEVQTLIANVQSSETSAFLQSTINTHGVLGQATYVYSDDPTMGLTYELLEAPFTSNTPQLFEREATFLTPNTTYYYFPRVRTIGGTAYGDTLSFVTTVPYDVLSLDSVFNFENTPLQFFGTVSGFSENAQLTLEYGTTAQFSNSVVPTPSEVNDNGTYLVSYEFASQPPSGSYHFRLKAETVTDTYYSNTHTLYIGLPYTALEVTDLNYDIQTGVAEFNGYIEGAELPGQIGFSFWYWSGGGEVPGTPSTVNSPAQTFTTSTIDTLLPETEYEVSMYFYSSQGSYYSLSQTLYTGVQYENFATMAAKDITPTSALLRGSVNDLSYAADLSFEYGLTEQFGQEIPASPQQVGVGEQMIVDTTIEGLIPDTTYFFRLKGNSSGTEFHSRTRRFYTGPPEIPNWNFQSWKDTQFEYPVGWSALDSISKVDLGQGNFAVSLLNSVSGVISGYFIGADGPDFQGTVDFNHRPDSVFLVANYDFQTSDSASVLVLLDSAGVPVSQNLYFLAGNSSGNFEEIGFEIDYQLNKTPDRLFVAILGFNIENDVVGFTPFNSFIVDRVHFGSGSPQPSVLEFNDWATYNYMDAENWTTIKHITDNDGILLPPLPIAPVLINQTDTAIQLNNLMRNDDVISMDFQNGIVPFDEHPFSVDRFHESLTGYVKFDKQGTDTLDISLSCYYQGEHVGYAMVKLGDPILELTEFDLPFYWEFNVDSNNAEIDACDIQVRIENRDNSSLSSAILNDFGFDGFYVGQLPEPDNVTEYPEPNIRAYPNPTRGLVNLSNVPSDCSIKVFDAYGKLIEEVSVKSNVTEVDLSGEKGGIYFMSLANESYRKTIPIIVLGGNDSFKND